MSGDFSVKSSLLNSARKIVAIFMPEFAEMYMPRSF